MPLSLQFQKFLSSATKEDIKDMRFLIEHPEYEHVPVSMKEFLENPAYTGQGDRVRPKIKEILIDFFDSGKTFDEFRRLGKYEEMLLVAGIGSGKSFLASKAIQYIIYRLLCWKNPQITFHLSNKSNIAFINISRSQLQARNVVFGEIKNRIDNSPWFQKYYPPDPRIKSVLRFPKNIFVIPLGSNEEAPLGYSPFGAIIDEASFHTVTRDKDYAQAAYEQISNRIISRFGNTGKLFIITSPKFIYDFAEKKFAEDTRTTVYKKRLRTWEAIPPEQFCGQTFDLGKYISKRAGVLIPIEYEDKFKQNPERAWRDLGAEPSASIQGLFRDPAVILAAVNRKRAHPWNEEVKEFYPWFNDPIENKHFNNEKRYIHIDLGLDRDGKGDKAGMVMGYFNGWENYKLPDGKIERRPKIFIDYIQRFTGSHGGEIKFSTIRDRIYKIKELGYNISKITFDSYQSVGTVQTLNDTGLRAGYFSVDRTPEAYYMTKSAILEGRLDFYNHPILIKELQMLEEIDGRKIDHGRHSTKDISDALAAVVYHCSQRTPGTGILAV